MTGRHPASETLVSPHFSFEENTGQPVDRRAEGSDVRGEDARDGHEVIETHEEDVTPVKTKCTPYTPSAA